ncbi:MAG TPA: hypothetical protein VNS12_13650 [Pelagibacterium sp.]|uniref:hypothetical protein n=1 Tax=Pelagibacterium sp. TaxID=1967288 RepID=UPI002BB01BDA|nr:hypothetical protein [Pelagibacterium sp.]HWJ89107.1 hypothetical protein [Pelagibacterium sp.]
MRKFLRTSVVTLLASCCLIGPAMALELNLGIAKVGVDLRNGVKVDANVGGSRGVNVGADVGLGGDKLVGADVGASIGGSNGINADVGADVGGRRGLVDANVDANVGGDRGLNANVDVGVGRGSLVDVGVDVGIGGGGTATPGNPGGPGSPGGPGNGGNPGGGSDRPSTARPGGVLPGGQSLTTGRVSCTVGEQQQVLAVLAAADYSNSAVSGWNAVTDVQVLTLVGCPQLIQQHSNGLLHQAAASNSLITSALNKAGKRPNQVVSIVRSGSTLHVFTS